MVADRAKLCVDRYCEIMAGLSIVTTFHPSTPFSFRVMHTVGPSCKCIPIVSGLAPKICRLENLSDTSATLTPQL